MFVIAIVSQKGGSGKTTLAGHLSVQAGLSGIGPVAIVDTDPQGSLSAWWNEREAEMPLFVQTSLPDLRGHLDNLRQAGVKLVVIDTPPAITSAIHDVINVADYVVVPTKPSPHDLRAVGATVKLVQASKKPMVFVLNDASPRAKITFEAAIALSQHGTVAPVTIHHRTLFASSMIDGRTAQELESKGQSATEVMGLWEYLHARLNSEILPTAIGLDASRRFDGVASQKSAFDPSAPVSPELPQAQAPQVVVEEVAVESYAVSETETKTEVQEVQAELEPEAVPQPSGQPQVPVAASLVGTSKPASLNPAPETSEAAPQDLWAGFANETNDPSTKAADNGNHKSDQRDFVHRPKVFGRRQGI